FTYPILQVADILLYQANAVPVGEDQRQHVELTLDLAQRFNSRYGATFTVPEAHIVKETGKIVDLQDPTSKMSKSASSPKGIVSLLDPPNQTAKKIRSAVTDTGTEVRYDEKEKPGISNLLGIHSAISGVPVAELEERFAGRMYGDFKKEVAEVLVDFVTPFQERFHQYHDDPAELDRTLAKGAAKAREVASATLERAYDRIGFLKPLGSAGPAGA
ncbi:MAG: tryptophan--tRNA ligase, partial [Streptomycetaceae bacterium]|nr:tryptophan--tRNA ligase [Streptomycetaceae bacterium]